MGSGKSTRHDNIGTGRSEVDCSLLTDARVGARDDDCAPGAVVSADLGSGKVRVV